jgi:hypothetical protein
MGYGDYYGYLPQAQWVAANTTVYPTIITTATANTAYLVAPTPAAPAKDDAMAWLRGQVDEIRDLAFAT